MKLYYKLNILLFVIFMFKSFFIFSKQVQPVHSNLNVLNKTANLTVNIGNIESDLGSVRIHLYNSARKEFFPKKTKNCFQRQIVKIENGQSFVVFENLPNDIYCLSVHHDENSNEKMDTNFLGIPTEGWGISNNVKLFLRLPEFDECSFKLEGKNTSIYVEMRY